MEVKHQCSVEIHLYAFDYPTIKVKKLTIITTQILCQILLEHYIDFTTRGILVFASFRSQMLHLQQITFCLFYTGGISYLELHK